MNTQTIDTNTLRTLAIMQHNSEPFFQVDGVFYEGNETEEREKFAAENAQMLADEEIQAEDDYTFDEYCAENLTEVEELDEDDERDGYMALTDEEADEKAAEYIKDSLWAFNAGFIIEHSKLPYEATEMVQYFTESKCERANDTIEALIDDIDEFISDAISADGRAHFLNTYDGHEHEETVTIDGESYTMYVYRIN